MLRSVREHWRSARRIPLVRSLVEEIDRVWWTRTILRADLVDLDYVAAELGRRVTVRAAVRRYVRGGFRHGFGLNPLFMEHVVSEQLSDAERVPALYAYLVNDQSRLRVATHWDAPEYLARFPEAREAPGAAVGHAWRAARAGADLSIGPTGAARPRVWAAILSAAVRALRTAPAAPVGLHGCVFLFLLDADDDVARALDAAVEIVRADGGTVLVATAAGNPEQRAATAILGLWDDRIRLAPAPADPARALTDAGATRLIVRGPRAEISAADLRALADAAESGPVEPLWRGEDGTVAAAGTARRDGRAVRLLRGHPAEDARALGALIPSAGPAGATFALPLPRDPEAGWRTLVGAEVVAPDTVAPLARPLAADAPDARDLLRPLGWDWDDTRTPARIVRPPRTATLADGSVVPSLRWAIKTAAPSGRRGEAWGDTHFARGIAAALRRLGQEVVIDAYPARDRPSRGLDDVVLALRGPFRIDPQPGAFSMLWIISHPDEITADEVAGFDRVFAASGLWARTAAPRLGRPIEPLLQCTDTSRFHPSGATRGSDLVFVGTARGIARPSVVEPLRAGVPVRVYGPDWTGYIPASAVVAPGIANDRLPLLYETAGAVLNDHWPAMRAEGFVSNRLFDVVAAGGRAVSDDVDGIAALFGDAVRTYADVPELLELVTQPVDTLFPDDVALAAIGERIRAEHSFDARAAALLRTALAR